MVNAHIKSKLLIIIYESNLYLLEEKSSSHQRFTTIHFVKLNINILFLIWTYSTKSKVFYLNI